MIKNVEIRNVKDGMTNFIYITVPKEVGINMLEVQRLADGLSCGCIPCAIFPKGGEYVIRYKEVSKITVAYFTETRLTKDRLLHILKETVSAMKKAQEKGLSIENLVLDKKHIYLDSFSNKLLFIYMPVKTNVFEKVSMKDFVIDLMLSAPFDEKDDLYFYIKLQNLVAGDKELTLDDLKGLLGEWDKELEVKAKEASKKVDEPVAEKAAVEPVAEKEAAKPAIEKAAVEPVTKKEATVPVVERQEPAQEVLEENPPSDAEEPQPEAPVAQEPEAMEEKASEETDSSQESQIPVGQEPLVSEAVEEKVSEETDSSQEPETPVGQEQEKAYEEAAAAQEDTEAPAPEWKAEQEEPASVQDAEDAPSESQHEASVDSEPENEGQAVKEEVDEVVAAKTYGAPSEEFNPNFYSPGQAANPAQAPTAGDDEQKQHTRSSRYAGNNKPEKENEEEIQYKRFTSSGKDAEPFVNPLYSGSHDTPAEDEGTTLLTYKDDGTTVLGANNEENAMRPFLVAKVSGEETVINKDEFKMGRDSRRSDFVVNNKVVGRLHAKILSVGGEYFLEDVSSRNGTFLNGIRVRSGEKVKIKHDDKITLGNEWFTFKMY